MALASLENIPTNFSILVPVPVDLRQPIDLQVMPPMLLLPTDRRVAQFSVGIERNTQFPVVGELEVRAPAAFAMRRDRQSVSLVEQRRVLLGFEVERPDHGCYAPPCTTGKWLNRWKFIEPVGNKCWGFAGGVYLVHAIKRVHSMRLVMPRWKDRSQRAKALSPIAQKESPHGQ